MRYQSTRGGAQGVGGLEAVLQGLAPDGGLYVPQSFPQINADEWTADTPFWRIAARILHAYFPEIGHHAAEAIAQAAYGSAWRDSRIAPVVHAPNSRIHLLELFHGPTCAFKDIALCVLPHLLSQAAARQAGLKEAVVLAATSGDTGKAALAGFADVPGTRILAYYPKGGVSPMQELQMVTQRGDNTLAAGVTGDFDVIQRGVKAMFEDEALNARLAGEGRLLTSANSINIGRLVPQIAYYYYGYAQLVGQGAVLPGEGMTVAVPTGNFGNILAASYAKRMGLPIMAFVCASNRNDVLTRFFHTRVYDRNRPLELTQSPSMDILVSSNLERFLYHEAGGDAALVAGLMRQLRTDGRYTLPQAVSLLGFFAGSAEDAAARAAIRSVYRQDGILLDPHTAVGAAVCGQYRESTGDQGAILLAATASPFKFAASVLQALDVPVPQDPFAQLSALEPFAGYAAPAPLAELAALPVRHSGVYTPQSMPDALTAWLRGKG